MTHLIIGLGNPGEEYENTRHNIGRDVVLHFAKKNDFSDFSENKKLKSLISEGNLPAGRGKHKVVLMLPETFMNKSGDAALLGASYFKAKPENIFVVHDDIDIPFGTSKICFNKGAGGHKGVENIIKKLKTKEFFRVRIGINPTKKKKDAIEIVLKKFGKKDELELKKIKKKLNEALLCSVSESPDKAMQLCN